MLAARRARGGNIVVLMRPSLPLRWFDLCLVPKHDCPPSATNVIVSHGTINPIIPTGEHRPDRGLILIGGPSRHYGWDNGEINAQIRDIVNSGDGKWILSDSPRTPEDTRRSFLQLTFNNLEYVPYHACAPGWLPQQLGCAGVVWVSRDSMTMIYESLTSGAAVGLLDVPAQKNDRIVRAIEPLITENLVTPFQHWRDGIPLSPAAIPLNEADRCARALLERLGLTP